MATPTPDEMRQFVLETLQSLTAQEREVLADVFASVNADAQQSRTLGVARDKQYAHRILEGGSPVTKDGSDALAALNTTSLFDTLNFVNGRVRVNDENRRQADIQMSGGADCMFDYLVSTCWAAEVAAGRGTEGQVFTSLTGCTFKVYSTIQAALTDAAANFTATNMAVVLICPGLYTENVTQTSTCYVMGAGRGQDDDTAGDSGGGAGVIVAPASNADTWTFSTNSNGSTLTNLVVRSSGTTASGKDAIDIDIPNQVTILDVTVLPGGASNFGIRVSGGTDHYISGCRSLGAGTGFLMGRPEVVLHHPWCTGNTIGIDVSYGAAAGHTQITDPTIDSCTTGIRNNSSGAKFLLKGGWIHECTTGISLIDGTKIKIDGVHFDENPTNLSVAGAVDEDIWIINNSFDLGGTDIGISWAGTNSYAVVDNNIFRDNGGAGTPISGTLGGWAMYGTNWYNGGPLFASSVVQNAAIGMLRHSLETSNEIEWDQFYILWGATLVTVAAATALTQVALTPSATNYVEVNSSGTVSANTVGFTAGQYPLAVIVTTATDPTSFTPVAPALSHGGLSSGTTATAPHNILDGGTAHLDSETDGATKGSIIVGNATPKWDEFVVGTNGQRIVADSTQTLGVAWINGVGTYFDAIVDNADPYDDEVGINVYSTIALAIAGGHRSIFLRGTAGDSSDITIASGDTVKRIVGQDGQTSLIPVNVICNKADVLFESVQFFDGAEAKYLQLNGARDVAFACVFLGALDSSTALLNSADGTPVNIVSSTNASPINVQATAHGLATGDGVVITGHTVNTNANGRWTVTFVDANNVTLNGSLGNGVGGATGTITKQGLSASGLSIPFDNGANGGLPARGVMRIDNEVIGYSAGGTATSGTLTVTNANGHNMCDTINESHSDNATITSLYNAHLQVKAADCQVVQCRFVACNNANVHCLAVYKNGYRARLISNVFLANTVWSCICGIGEDSGASLEPPGVQIIGSSFDSNTITDFEITGLPSDTSRTTGEKQGWGIAGNLIRNQQGAAILLFGRVWNVTGNNIDGSATNARSAAINKGGGISAGDTVIPFDGESGTGSFGAKVLLLIESEFVLAWKSGTDFVGCIRGALGSTAAIHADNVTIQNMSQRAFQNRQVSSTSAGPLSHLLSGNTIGQTKVVTVSNGGNTNHCRVTFADNVIGNNCFQIYSEDSANWINNVINGLASFDLRGKSTQIIFGGKLRDVPFANVAADTFLFVPGAVTVTGVPTTLMIPAGRIFALGRAAGDLVQVAVPLTNRTGANSVAAACVAVDNANDNSFDDNPGAASTRICGVCVEGGIADASPALVAVAGVVTVTCTTAGAVTQGDVLEISATAGQAQTAAVPVAGGTLGHALTAKAAITAGSVKCLLG